MTAERILVVGLNWLGDAVMSMPAIQALREARPGAHLALLVDAELFKRIMLVILPLTALYLIFRKKDFDDPGEELPPAKTLLLSVAIALTIGAYDGFYGPGTGTFLIIAFSLLAKMDVRSANGQCKAVNLTTNVTSLLVYLRSGNALIALGLTAAACNMLGSWIGSGLAIHSGAKITRPIILLVLALLLLKVLGVFDMIAI